MILEEWGRENTIEGESGGEAQEQGGRGGDFDRKAAQRERVREEDDETEMVGREATKQIHQ